VFLQLPLPAVSLTKLRLKPLSPSDAVFTLAPATRRTMTKIHPNQSASVLAVHSLA
jgi:hypothetical protein